MKLKKGLTLGKYAPFHKGHQHVIETALAEVDELWVIIYDAPETTSVPLSVRSNWIQTLYPDIHIVQAWDGPQMVGDTPGIRKMHEDYILNHLKIKDITHFYSSEFYGQHMSCALGAINRQVDPSRETVRVSGFRIRENPFAFRHFMDPVVYQDLIVNVVFLGAPSTGKTTLAKALAKVYHTQWMPEFGRAYWEKNQKNRRLTLDQLNEIAHTHLDRENKMRQKADQYLFVDTNALTTRLFSLHYHQAVHPRLDALAHKAARQYDLVFVCDTDIPYNDTWDRSGRINQLVFQKQVVDDLKVRKIPFFRLRGDLETRINYVRFVLSGFQKFQNPADLFSTSRDV